MRPRLTSIASKASLFTPFNSTRQSSATTAKMSTTTESSTIESSTISKITEKDKEITHNDGPVKVGPTAQAQEHVGETPSSRNISDIAQGERKISGNDTQAPGDPATTAQSMATSGPSNIHTATNGTNGEPHIGKLDSSTIPKNTTAKQNISGKEQPLQGGPTAQAQNHAGDNITSETLHDIAEGEKMITGGGRVKGGPTGTTQSELGKSRD
jgi:hypothetical protein